MRQPRGVEGVDAVVNGPEVANKLYLFVDFAAGVDLGDFGGISQLFGEGPNFERLAG